MNGNTRADPDQALIRGIGRWGLTAFALNLTVGSGILGLPARLHALVGGYSIAVMIACGVLIALIAICFAEIASRFDRTGGPQLYATVAFGPVAGFMVGWLLWISRLGTCAAVSNLMTDYGQVLLPVLARPGARDVTITAMVAAYAGLNIRGIRHTAAVSTAFTVAKIVPLFVIAAAGLFFVAPRSLHFGPPPPANALTAAFLLATFAFFGFDTATVLAGEVKDARHSVPFAIFLSVGIVTTLYTLIQIVCVGVLPDLAVSDRPIADVAATIAGSWASVAVAVMAVVACAGLYGASITPATRLLYAMAGQGQLPTGLARVNPHLRTPVPAIVVSSAAALALALSGSFIYLVNITVISRITVYAASCLTLPVFRRRADLPPAATEVPAGSVVAFGCAVLCALFLAKSSMREVSAVMAGALLGGAIFGLTRMSRRRVLVKPP